MNEIQNFIRDESLKPNHEEFADIIDKLTYAQQNTLNAAIDILNHHRAVLLYEMTGTGKTYVASALAAVCQRHNASECIIVAPANLLNMWKSTADLFQLKAQFYSYQAASLHHISAPSGDDAIWLIDEAHLLKNPSTNRYSELQILMARHRICLITATPLSMGWQDLYALMRLCGFPQSHTAIDETWLRAFAVALMPQSFVPPLDSDATFKSSHALIPYQITGDKTEFDKLIQSLNKIQWLTQLQNGELSDVRLLPHILVHRLLSHRNACLITLHKLERYYAACRIHSSRQMLSRKEFQQMMGIEGKQQILPFDELIFGGSLNDKDRHQLSQALAFIRQALEQLQRICNTPDDKIDKLKAFIHCHPNQKIVIFTQYSDTANHIAASLKNTCSLAMLTASQSFYKSYPVETEILLAMFDPNMKLPDWWRKTGQPEAQILVCSDAFSCGHNLQKAEILIHFDLPWNPTTIHQREGRLLRKGQQHSDIQIHQMTLRDAPKLVKNFDELLKNRLSNRKHLQSHWLKAVTPLPASQFLFANSQGIPRIWARNQDLWVPVSSHSLPDLDDNLQIQKMTLAEAFDITFHQLKPKYENLYRIIKQYRHFPNVIKLQKNAFKSFYDMAIFPQLQANEFIKQTFTCSDSDRLCAQINAMTVKSIPSPNTPCWKVTIYPQVPPVTTQATHKLSTGYSPKQGSVSPIFAVNTES